MIKLIDILKEHEGEQKPYMYSPVGFGCHVCEYYYMQEDKHMCKNEDYANYMGTNELIDENGNQIEDPSKWCSNWFEPKASIDEESKGLWHNIRAKRERGEAPAKKGSKAHKAAVKAAKEINKNK